MTIVVGLNTFALWVGMRETYEPVIGRRWRRARRRVERETDEGDVNGQNTIKDEAKKVLMRTFTVCTMPKNLKVPGQRD